MILVRFVINALALAAATWLLPGITLANSSLESKIVTVLVVAIVFGVVNAIVKPIFTFITAPFIFLTLGIFLLVINALLLLLTSWISGLLGQSWHVDGFWWAVAGSLIISVVSWLLSMFLPDKNNERQRRD